MRPREPVGRCRVDLRGHDLDRALELHIPRLRPAHTRLGYCLGRFDPLVSREATRAHLTTGPAVSGSGRTPRGSPDAAATEPNDNANMPGSANTRKPNYSNRETSERPGPVLARSGSRRFRFGERAHGDRLGREHLGQQRVEP